MPQPRPNLVPQRTAPDKTAYPVFPEADAGADPSVPAGQGGRGFTGEGWQTNTDYDLIGDPRAIKGGVLRQAMMTDFPATFRYYGPNNSEWNLSINELVYESLLYLHPTTLEFIPGLATHWQISSDRLTYRFRINPNARWSDGMPVTADDVVASWRLTVDKGIQDPARNLQVLHLRAAGCGKQVHRLGQGEKRQLAELHVLCLRRAHRRDVHLSRPRLENPHRRRLHP